MLTSRNPRRTHRRTFKGVGRRTAIKRSLGMALAGSLWGHTKLSAAGNGIELPDGMRRIVTGHNSEGKSYIVSDERVMAGPFPNLFQTTGADPFGPGPEDTPRNLLPTDSPQLEPAVGGANFVFVTLPPTMSNAELFWHRTETVDINVLLGGELILVLEKEETTLHPGDAAHSIPALRLR